MSKIQRIQELLLLTLHETATHGTLSQ